MNHIKDIQENIKPLREALINHDLYHYIETPDDLRIFTQHHVFAVWDFMSLAKALQQNLTCVNVPWTPVNNSSEYTYLINDIILAEESDINWNGKRQSHFEMYKEAMNSLGATTVEINNFIEQVQNGTDIFLIISASDLPKPVKSFLIFTFNTIFHHSTAEILSAFTFGREDLIPDMFSEIIGNIENRFPKENISKLKYYFDRHIEIDADEHGPMALEMLEMLCKNDLDKWKSVEDIAIKSIKKRLNLWNGIKNDIQLFKAIV
jgi:hypothetical protein